MKLGRDFYLRDGITVARELIGKILVHETPMGRRSGRIVETEAYLGKKDAAAHSYKGDPCGRTRIQYGQGGYAYIYMIYGVHYCMNVVANLPGEPEAVLPLSKLAALLDEWTKPKSTPGGGTGGGGETVVFSPVFNFYGGTPSREEAEEAGRISFAEFKKLYRQMKAEEKRKQFSPA